MINNDVRECKVLFGGCRKGNKKDKSTGIKTADEYFTLQILEIDDDNYMVTSKMFYIDEDLYEKVLDLNIKLLSECLVYIKSSATSNYTKLIDVKKYIEKNIVK